MTDAVRRGPEMDTRLVAGIVDVFVYVVVLNLFVEYLPAVVSETFTLSLLTAVLLKGVLELVVALKDRIKARLRSASSVGGRVVAAFLLWLVLFGSKFVVLELVDLVFGDRVQLGAFFSVTLLIVVLMLARAGVRRLVVRPAAPDAAVPNSAVPNSAVPNSAVPNSAVPNSAVPNSAVPNSAAPTGAASDSSA